MKTLKQIISLGLLFVLAIYGCAGPSLPQGAQKIGRYEGTFSSALLSGSCQFDLYRLPDVFLTLKGKMTGNHLEGTVFGEDVFGGSTVSGDLSADEKRVSGTFALNAPYSPKGTWVATRK